MGQRIQEVASGEREAKVDTFGVGEWGLKRDQQPQSTE